MGHGHGEQVVLQVLLRNAQTSFFTACYKSRLPADESTAASFMSELLKLRDSYLDFSGVFHLDQSGIATLIDFVATA